MNDKQRPGHPDLSSGEASPPGGAAPARILVVDDEIIVRMLIVELLEEQGYSVIEAPDGPSALAALDDAGGIDLLVTDVGLPGGMNGRQLAGAVRERLPDLGVLFVTGYADMQTAGDELPANTAVVAKPFRGADLLAPVAALLPA